MLGPPWGPRGCLWRRGAAGADSHVQGLGLGAVPIHSPARCIVLVLQDKGVRGVLKVGFC